jgi:hypothetical protein
MFPMGQWCADRRSRDSRAVFCDNRNARAKSTRLFGEFPGQRFAAPADALACFKDIASLELTLLE